MQTKPVMHPCINSRHKTADRLAEQSHLGADHDRALRSTSWVASLYCSARCRRKAASWYNLRTAGGMLWSPPPPLLPPAISQLAPAEASSQLACCPLLRMRPVEAGLLCCCCCFCLRKACSGICAVSAMDVRGLIWRMGYDVRAVPSCTKQTSSSLLQIAAGDVIHNCWFSAPCVKQQWGWVSTTCSHAHEPFHQLGCRFTDIGHATRTATRTQAHQNKLL